MHGSDADDRIWQRRAARLFVWLAIGGLVYLFAGTVLQALLPFLLAALLSAPILPAARWLEGRIHLPRRRGAILLLILLLLLLGILLSLLCGRVVSELQRLADSIGTDAGLWRDKILHARDVLTTLSEHIPWLSRLRGDGALAEVWESVDARLAALISDALTSLGARIPEVLAALAKGVPGALIFTLTTLLAAFYLCADGDAILASLTERLPDAWQARLEKARGTLARLGGKYVRAYLILFLLTFFALFLGFCILRLPYTFLPALLIALVDLLPLIGVPAVLLPWGAILLWQGDLYRGTGLLILCAVMLILRQILEPRILGGSLGLHPLLTLFSAYLGLQFFGLFGMLLGPALALALKGVLPPQRSGGTN